ncbi:S-adenosylmethionine sensor upstream of mTORC1 isoform X1 [Temnothorax longispinosus]|uniref:S-adenosylmethionine sensor upstream of mTORC1 n=2 Tax=Temnothorax longispinosus TaxID=300112 RepID=A0A4S2JBE6_9HYME|nr:S-adenosylmethionine sensor upstream of mTORC1 [Temnothorax longispinosus]
MATEEHKRLADIVKGTHALLRAECHQYGAEIAWKRHLARNDVLQEYAASMQKLAVKCWADNNSDLRSGTYCRMEWIKAQCKEYFLNGGREKYNKRERDINAKMTLSSVGPSVEGRTRENNPSGTANGLRDSSERRISVLDVGSCYNPLSIDDAFDVTAIDLTPTVEEVYRCDFLNVAIGGEKILSRDTREIRQLPADFYDSVVFSLLLEYLPCPEQRYACCGNAYDVLKSGGILIVASPDSKHVGANAKLMRSWRYALSRMGFMRIKYEKLRHIHCLVFRKCVRKDVAIRWSKLQRFSEADRRYACETKIFIPQDFQATRSKEEREKLEYEETDLASAFSELPFDNETST